MMKGIKYSATLMAVLTLAFIFVGCAKPPDAEKSAAKAAMDAAVTAGADKYAAGDFEAAKGRWDSAESQMGNKNYKEAKQNYLDAKSAFEKAVVTAKTGKKTMTDAVTAALPSLENDWKILKTAAKKAGKNMKDKKADWTTDEKAFTEDLRAAKDMVVMNPLGAEAKIAGLTFIIDKWDALLNALTTASAKADVLKRKISQRRIVRSHFSVS